MTMTGAATISIRYAHRLIETAVAMGAERGDLERVEYLASVERASDARITARQYFDLWAAAMDQLQDPTLPLRVAAATGIETHELFGFVCMTRPTFRDGLEGASRYLKIWTDLARWQLRPEDGGASLLLIPGTDRHPAARFAAECMLAEILVTGRQYLGVVWSPRAVHFAWRRPSDVAHLSAFFGAELVFDAAQCAVVLDDEVLSLPLVKSDPSMATFFTGHAEEMLRRSPDSSQLAGEVRMLIASGLANGSFTLDAVASRLGVSSRTLRRRLEAERESFNELVQQTRCALAKQHLQEGRLSLGEIGYVLGFSDVTAFHRSFRRATGMTPAAYREQSGGDGRRKERAT